MTETSWLDTHLALILSIAGCTLVTLLPKFLPVTFIKGDNLPVVLRHWLSFVPVAVMAALVGPDIFIYEGHFSISPSNLFLMAGLPTLLVAWWFKNYFLTIVVGIGQVLSDRRLVTASAVEGVQNMGMGALEAFLPIYAVTVVGLSEFQAGLLWGAQIFVTMLSKPLLGKMSDARGRRGLIVAGLVLCGGALAAIPFLHAFLPLLVASLVFGMGEALVTSSSAALVADMCRDRQFGSAMGAFGTIFDIGHASGPICAGLLIGWGGYQVSFPLLAVSMIIAIPLFLKNVPRED